jgi:putative spermidine/putrescine transport system permease protein
VTSPSFLAGRFRRRQIRSWLAGGLLILPALAFLVVLFVLPVAQLVIASFQDSAGALIHYRRIFGVPVYLLVLWRTIWISAVTALICLVLGFPVAYRLCHASRWAKAAILLCVLLSFWTNLLVRAFSWMVLLNPNGIINHLLIASGLPAGSVKLIYNTTGVLIGQTQILLPYMILPLAAVMTRVDFSLVNAARSLGASPYRAFIKVYLPLVRSGALAGCVLVFTLSLGSFVVPALLGGSHDIFLAQLIEFNINNTLNLGFASALATMLLSTTLVLYWIGDRWFGLGQIWGGR